MKPHLDKTYAYQHFYKNNQMTMDIGLPQTCEIHGVVVCIRQQIYNM